MPDWGLQKKLLKYILKKTVGPFLAQDLELDQLDLQLTNGVLVLENVAINVNVCCWLRVLCACGVVERRNERARENL